MPRTQAPADPAGGRPPAGVEAARATVTIRDVAIRAGVSLGTASKALNGQGKLRDETRHRVIAAARELGFAPNVLARGLVSGRTYTVGLVTTDSFGRFSIPVMLGVEDALGSGKISVFMCDTRDDVIRERHYLDMLLGRQVDGIIVSGRRVDSRPSIGTNLRVPVVYAMTQSDDPDEPAVLPDDYAGGRLAADHLLTTGRRRIVHLTGPERFLAARERTRGFLARVTEAGPDGEGPLVLYGEWTEQWGRQAADLMLRQVPDVDAVFCGSDQIARGVVERLRLTGHRIPEDVAVVGFDNWEPMVTGCDPPLTSIDSDLERVGNLAAQLLLSAIDGQPARGVHVLPPRLVIRASSVPTAPRTTPVPRRRDGRND
jgi:LacI family transcriptional regulator